MSTLRFFVFHERENQTFFRAGALRRLLRFVRNLTNAETENAPDGTIGTGRRGGRHNQAF